MLIQTFCKLGNYRTNSGNRARITRVRMTTMGWILEGGIHLGENIWQLGRWDSAGFSEFGLGSDLREAV